MHITVQHSISAQQEQSQMFSIAPHISQLLLQQPQRVWLGNYFPNIHQFAEWLSYERVSLLQCAKYMAGFYKDF